MAFSEIETKALRSTPNAIAFMDEEVDPSATLRVNTERLASSVAEMSRGVELEPEKVPVSYPSSVTLRNKQVIKKQSYPSGK